MDRRRAWAWAWGAWAGATSVSFGVLEGIAIRKGYHPTLSTTLRRVLGIHPRTRWGKVALGAVAALWTWFIIHLAIIPQEHRTAGWERLTIAIWTAHPIAAWQFRKRLTR